MSVYSIAGATLSEKNVSEEYQLSSAQLDKGVESGALKVQWRSFHGNLYRLFIRSEVSAYVGLVGPDTALKAAYDARVVKQNLVSKRTRLDAVTAELSGIDAKKAALVKEKQDLEQWLMANDPKAATQAAKDAAKVAKETTKKATKQAAKATKSGSQKRKLDDESS